MLQNDLIHESFCKINKYYFPNRSLLLRVLMSNQRGDRTHTKREAASAAARPRIAKAVFKIRVFPCPPGNAQRWPGEKTSSFELKRVANFRRGIFLKFYLGPPMFLFNRRPPDVFILNRQEICRRKFRKFRFGGSCGNSTFTPYIFFLNLRPPMFLF